MSGVCPVPAEAKHNDNVLGAPSKQSGVPIDKLRPRFFGDSILLTCAVENEKSFQEQLERVAFTVSAILSDAFNKGVLLRGALAIGDYIEDEDVALGPAITDAAYWYEKLDMIGVMCTPSSAMTIKSSYFLNLDEDACDKSKHECRFLPSDMIFETVSLSQSKEVADKIETYVIDWPAFAIQVICGEEEEDPMFWFYRCICHREYRCRPPYTEVKYKNTESFFRKSLNRYSVYVANASKNP